MHSIARQKSATLPSALPNIVRVTCDRFLGILIDCNFKFCEHVDNVVKVCSQRFYLLQQMQGLDANCLKVVLHSIVISKVLYALPAWSGYISQENISWINKLLQKAKRYGFTDILHSFKDFMAQSDEKLFSRTFCSNHCLCHLLHPDRSPLDMSFRPRGHCFDVPRYNMTWLENLSFSGVYLITDDFSERMTCVCLCNDWFVLYVLERQLMCVDSWCVLIVDCYSYACM